MIPNPSFEYTNPISNRWSSTHSTFNRLMINWNSPTQGSPDILHLNSRGKMHPKRPKVFLMEHEPRTGKIMVGIKTYGCQTNTLHCKEYLQVQPTQPILKGHQYYFEYWISPLRTSPKVSGFGIAGVSTQMNEPMNTNKIDLIPLFVQDSIATGDDRFWQRVNGTFTATENYGFIIIGNFANDETIQKIDADNGIDYGYYLVDDVLLLTALLFGLLLCGPEFLSFG